MSRAPAPVDTSGSDDERDLYRALLERQWRAQLDDVTRLSLELADAHGARGLAAPAPSTRP
jgi:hypothetical protein